MKFVYEEILNQLKENKDNPQKLLDRALEAFKEKDPKIRDELVFFSLQSFIREKTLDANTSLWLFERLIGEKGIGLEGWEVEKTLNRSFSAMLLSSVFYVDNSSFKQLTGDRLERAFEALSKFALSEKDFRSETKEVGWVHCHAHISDALTCLVICENCTKELASKCIELTEKIRNLEGSEDFDEDTLERLGKPKELAKLVGKV